MDFGEGEFVVRSCQPEADEPLAQEFVDTDHKVWTIKMRFLRHSVVWGVVLCFCLSLCVSICGNPFYL
jgi:hypothetical protein